MNTGIMRYPKYALIDVPPPPDSAREASQREWRRLAPIVFKLGYTTPADLRALELLCDVLATTKELEAVIAEEGALIDAGSGGKKAHPALRILESARKQAHVLLRDFGLTPSSRRNPCVPRDVPDSWLEEGDE